MSITKIKPGDMIEWVYRDDGSVVLSDEVLYSSTMKQWVPVERPALLISIADGIYTWLSEEGRLFHARVDDTNMFGDILTDEAALVPRACTRAT